MDADAYQALTESTDQHYVGIGVQVMLVPHPTQQMAPDAMPPLTKTAERQPAATGKLMVLRVFEGSPAAEVGILPGDQFVRVGAVSVMEADTDQLADLLKGEPATTVQVHVLRGQQNTTLLDFTMTRREVDYPSVYDAHLRPDGTAYLELTQFGSRTYEELITELQRLKHEGMQRLILDLRNNPGGLLDQAIQVASLFVAESTVIVQTRDRDGNILDTGTTTAQPLLPASVPVAILINRYSASASELLAGSLQLQRRAFVVGETSFGKGSVQAVYRFGDGSGATLTMAYYTLADGTTVHEHGITPDIEVTVPEPEPLQATPTDFEQRKQRLASDPAVQAAAEALLKKTLPHKQARRQHP